MNHINFNLLLVVSESSSNLLLFRDVIEDIKNLYSPFFPLDIVKNYVMTALAEAVDINQVHNRDPIGGSNENLFL